MRDRFFWGPRRGDQYCCHGEADLLLRCFYFSAFHAVLEMRSNNATGGKKINQPNFWIVWCVRKIVESLLREREQRREDDAVVNLKKLITGNFVRFKVLASWMNHEIDFDPDDIYIRDCSLLCSVASLLPKAVAKLCIECRWTPSCPLRLGNRPLQTGCLSEALTSSALIALTGSGRLFISPLFFTESSLWLIWRRLKPCSVIYLADNGKDGHQRNMKELCVCVFWRKL